jgi:hypothetical protein
MSFIFRFKEKMPLLLPPVLLLPLPLLLVLLLPLLLLVLPLLLLVLLLPLVAQRSLFLHKTPESLLS